MFSLLYADRSNTNWSNTCWSIRRLADDFEIAIHIGELVHLLEVYSHRSPQSCPETCNTESIRQLINRSFVVAHDSKSAKLKYANSRLRYVFGLKTAIKIYNISIDSWFRIAMLEDTRESRCYSLRDEFIEVNAYAWSRQVLRKAKNKISRKYRLCSNICDVGLKARFLYHVAPQLLG